MKISDKKKLQQIALSHSLFTDFKDFIKIYKKYTAETYSFLVDNATLESDNPLRFRKKYIPEINIRQSMIRLELKKYNTILTEKLPKYLLCHQRNLINMNILQPKKYCHLIKNK